MNQTFNLKRFCRYAVSYLRVNKWYLLIMVVLFMIPATVLSVLSTPEPDGVLVALAIGLVMVGLRTNLPDSSMRHLVSESSVAEKFTTESVLKIAFVGIPFAVHAALANNGAQQPFADGFDIDYLAILWVVMWLSTTLRTPRYGSLNTESARRKMEILMYVLFSIEYIFFFIDRYVPHAQGPQEPYLPYPLWVKILLLAVGTALLVLSYYLFNKRYVDYNKDE